MSSQPVEMFLRLLGFQEDSQVVLAIKDRSTFRGSVCDGITEAGKTARRHALDSEVWITVNEMGPLSEGRGTAEDVIRLSALWADLDYKDGGVVNEAGARALIDRLERWLGYAPAVIVHSGGGLQPYWLVEDGREMLEARVLLLRWRALVEREASALGYRVDPVFDLPRVMRAPGSVNRKQSAPRPVSEEWSSEYEARTIADLHDILSDAHVPTPSLDDLTGAEPIEAATVSGWLSDGAMCQSCERVLEAWDEARVDALHPSTLTAIGKLLRLGEQGHVGTSDAMNTLWTRFADHAVKGGSSGTDKRTISEANTEWREMFRPTIIRKIASRPTSEVDRGCCGRNAARHDDDMLGALPAPEWKAQGEPGMPDLDTLFDSSETLKHIRQAALSRSVSPVAVLECLLVIATTAAGPSYVLPPHTGSRAALNLFVLLTGRVGSGKTAAWSTAKDLLPDALEYCYLTAAGSGEGILDAFLDSDGETMTRYRVLMFADEIGQVASTNSRTGSTFMSFLRQTSTGSDVGTGNVKAGGRRRFIKARTYRLGMIMGAQPELAHAFLTPEEVAGGTPQRFLWAPMTRPKMNRADRPEWPGELSWLAPTHCRELDGVLDGLVAGTPETLIEYPEEIIDYVVEAQMEAVDAFGEPNMKGHVNLLRLKVATALAMLHGVHGSFDEEHWEWAGQLIDISEETTAATQNVIGAAVRDQARARGAMDWERTMAAANAEQRELVTALRLFVRRIQDHAEDPHAHPTLLGCSRKCFNPFKEQRGVRDAALGLGVAEGWLVDDGGRYVMVSTA